MKKWERVRFALKIFAASTAVVAAGYLAAGQLVAAAVVGAMGTHALLLAKDLPRDPWTPEEKRSRTRRPTRSNPLVTPAPVTPKEDV